MQTFTGTVVSNKTPQTVGVRITYFQKHPKYQKILKQTTKLLVHNELSGVSEGDTVKIVKSRPYSKMKHFKVVEIIAKKAGEEVIKPEVKEKKDELNQSKRETTQKATRKNAEPKTKTTRKSA